MHECPVCGMQFSWEDRLEEHAIWEDHHVCDLCGMPKRDRQLVSVETWMVTCEPCADRYMDARAPIDSAAGQ